MTTDPPPPRRKWHLQRWLLLLAAGFLAYAGWLSLLSARICEICG